MHNKRILFNYLFFVVRQFHFVSDKSENGQRRISSNIVAHKSLVIRLRLVYFVFSVRSRSQGESFSMQARVRWVFTCSLLEYIDIMSVLVGSISSPNASFNIMIYCITIYTFCDKPNSFYLSGLFDARFKYAVNYSSK